MAKSVLNVEPRVRTGKGGSRKVRADGLVPAVVYGKGVDALNLRVEPKALDKAVATEAGWNTLITLKGDGPFDGKVVILKDMQIDPIRREPLHVDFQAIDLTKKIMVILAPVSMVLDGGDVVHIDDVELPEGAEVPHDVNFTVLTVVGRKEEEEEIEEGAEEEAVEGAEEEAAESSEED